VGVSRRVWRDLVNVNVGFLAGGVAFSILLAGVPFVLMLSAALGYLLDQSPAAATSTVQGVMERVLPQVMGVEGSMLDPVLADVERTRAVFGIGGTLGFLWFSVRLFGSLRSVMKTVFAHERDRTVFLGIAWDLTLSVLTVALTVLWVGLQSFLTISSGRIGQALTDLGAREGVLSGVQLLLGRAIAFAVVVAIFGSLYRWLPKKKTDWIPTIAGGVTAALLFDLARWLFGIFIAKFPPTSVYSGTLGAIIVVVFWSYYAALIFVLGAQVAAGTTEELALAEKPAA
jgi:membrane protein